MYARDHIPADHRTCGGCCLILFSVSLDTVKSKCKNQSTDIIVTPSATIYLWRSIILCINLIVIIIQIFAIKWNEKITSSYSLPRNICFCINIPIVLKLSKLPYLTKNMRTNNIAIIMYTKKMQYFGWVNN